MKYLQKIDEFLVSRISESLIRDSKKELLDSAVSVDIIKILNDNLADLNIGIFLNKEYNDGKYVNDVKRILLDSKNVGIIWDYPRIDHFVEVKLKLPDGVKELKEFYNFANSSKIRYYIEFSKNSKLAICDIYVYDLYTAKAVLGDHNLFVINTYGNYDHQIERLRIRVIGNKNHIEKYMNNKNIITNSYDYHYELSRSRHYKNNYHYNGNTKQKLFR